MRTLRIFITFLLPSFFCYPIAPIEYGDCINAYYQTTSDIDIVEELFIEQNYSETIESYKRVLDNGNPNHSRILKKAAQSYAALNEVDPSMGYVEKYLHLDFNTDVFSDSWFDNVRGTVEFDVIKEKYAPKFSVLSFMYLYVALVGFYIAFLLLLKRKIDTTAKILISIFVFIHSFFILHICLNITNYQYQFPHSYLMSTCLSFLYGPLLYFYLKRITTQYKFKKTDVFHLVPTILFLIYIFPTYSLTGKEKLQLMLNRVSNGLNPSDSADMTILVVLKVISLVVYGYFIRQLYLNSKKQQGNLKKENRIWQRNIYFIHVAFILCYVGYGVLVTNNIISGFLYHSQVVFMALMVMYIGYGANIQPSVFNGSLSFHKLLFKYEKSGLTPSLSEELKENLINLFDVHKIYKENDINLEKLADQLNTTRHNASQVINEHFQMNFHELVNRYRISEAKEIFDTDSQRNLNIIDVAYEVGYNNKVTFNKAFKKDTQITPSQYQRMSVDAH